jgi:hypothetical protein
VVRRIGELPRPSHETTGKLGDKFIQYVRTIWGQRLAKPTSSDLVVGDAFGVEAVPWHLATKEFISNGGQQATCTYFLPLRRRHNFEATFGARAFAVLVDGAVVGLDLVPGIGTAVVATPPEAGAVVGVAAVAPVGLTNGARLSGRR